MGTAPELSKEEWTLITELLERDGLYARLHELQFAPLPGAAG